MKEKEIVIQLVVPPNTINTAVAIARAALRNKAIMKNNWFDWGLTLCSTVSDRIFLVEKREDYIKVNLITDTDLYESYSTSKDVAKSNVAFTDYI